MWMRKELLLNFICLYTQQFNVFPIIGVIQVWSQSQFNILWNQQKTTPVICNNSILKKYVFAKHKKPSRPSHITTDIAKKVVIVHTHNNFIHNSNDFSNSFVYGQKFSQRLFKKNCSKIVEVCKGLYTLIQPVVLQSWASPSFWFQD